MSKFLILIIAVFLSWAGYTHDGRTNSSGCHNNTKTKKRHCHSVRSKASISKRKVSGYTKVISSVDKMTDEKSYSTMSKPTPPIKKMAFPYNNLHSAIVFNCNSKDKKGFLSIVFNQNPNMTGGNFSTAGKNFKSRIRFDKSSTFTTTLFQPHSFGKGMYLKQTKEILKKMKNHSKMLVEFKMYGNGYVYFKYKDLKQFKKGIKIARKKCKKL